ncbi:hypothetical protein ACFCY8_11405 [Streptomyces noursei]|uniref:hypothetical protein n=1 Tax=Streptomyces noursei TaxID=1971 RepID=UPI0035DCD879
MMLNPSRPPALLRPFVRLTRPLARAGYRLTAESVVWWLLALVTYPATWALGTGLGGALSSLPPVLAVLLGVTVVPALTVVTFIVHAAVWLLPIVLLLPAWFLDRLGHRAA